MYDISHLSVITGLTTPSTTGITIDSISGLGNFGFERPKITMPKSELDQMDRGYKPPEEAIRQRKDYMHR